MLTVKVIDRKSREDIFCNVDQIIFTPKGNDSDASSLIISYVGEETQEFTWDAGYEKAYIMNENGKTVAAYEL